MCWTSRFIRLAWSSHSLDLSCLFLYCRFFLSHIDGVSAIQFRSSSSCASDNLKVRLEPLEPLDAVLALLPLRSGAMAGKSTVVAGLVVRGEVTVAVVGGAVVSGVVGGQAVVSGAVVSGVVGGQAVVVAVLAEEVFFLGGMMSQV